MVQNMIVLKDGTEIINGFVSRSSMDQLMIRIPGNNLVQAAMDFSDSNKTETIICYNSGYKYTYTGYTDMYTVQYFSDEDYVELWLRPAEGVQTSHTKELNLPKEYVPGGE